MSDSGPCLRGGDDANRILVLGGGPAGGTVALGLKRLGYQVTLISSPRPFLALEGISERVVEGLRSAGFVKALQYLPNPSPRVANWNGNTSAANTERLVDRSQLDQTILEDLADAGVAVILGRVLQTEMLTSAQRVLIQQGDDQRWLQACFVVEARGRAAPLAQLDRVRGCETLSLLQYWRGAPCTPRSAAQSFDQGWAWMAAGSDGTRYLQLTLDVASADLPVKSQLEGYCFRYLSRLDLAEPFMRDAHPSGRVYARTSTPILCYQAVGDNWIRVGDAAMAVDPLSGNGIFQALSSALQAPAVINTLIKRPYQAELAKRFYQDRLDHLFYRFARIGRDFYHLEASFSKHPFWQARCRWPDTQPVHPDPDPASVQAARRPVICDDFIIEAEVVISNEYPLGRWHRDGVELAPLLKAMQQKRD
ncbi:MAG: lycopene cyclase family protein [Halopseudomonas sp.]